MNKSIITVNARNIDEAMSAVECLVKELSALKTSDGGFDGSLENYAITEDDVVMSH